MARVRYYAMCTAIGGIVYWVPDIIVQWLLPQNRVRILLLTFGVPAVAALSWLLLSRRSAHVRHPVALPLAMLLGVWALAPLGTAVGAIPSGGTFLQIGHLREFLLLWLAFPVTTIMMSGYSGSLGGVGLATIFFICAARWKRRSNMRLQPPAESRG